MTRPLSVYNRDHKTLFVLAFVFFLMVFVALIYPASQSHAGSVVGDGGTGSGGTGSGYSYKYKYGWYMFSVSGSGPSGGFRNGTTWASAQAKCNAVGANNIVAFVYRNISYDQKIYSWQGENNPSNYAPVGPYMTVATAKSYYDAMGGGSPTYVWGINVGWFCYNSSPPTWDVSASSSVDKVKSSSDQSVVSKSVTIATVGDTLKWNHTLKNDGPSSTTAAVYSNIGMTGFSNPDFVTARAGLNVGGVVAAGAVIRTVSNDHNIYKVTSADVGSTLCQWLQYDPTGSSGGRNGRGVPSCVTIPYSFSLTPFITTNPSGVVEPSSSVKVSPSITNTSGSTKSKSIEWEVTKIVVNPGVAVPSVSGGISTVPPCGSYFSATGASCSNLFKGTSVFDTNGTVLSGDNINARSDAVGDLPVGTKICYAFSIKPYDQSSADWKHSAPACVTIGKKPKVTIWGGDLKVRGLVDTSTSLKSGTTYGSWVEYGIFSVGSVTGIASGSALADGVAASTSCNRSYLTFANAVTGVCSGSSPIGGFSNMSAVPAVAASFAVSSSTLSIDTAGVSNDSNIGLFKSTSPLTINTSNIVKGRWLVINAANTDININGDITYSDGPFNNIGEVPQVVIIANNINIAGGVKRVDAWLIATNSINTCSDKAVGSKLIISDCNQQLQVNGPVMTNHLYMQRTYGSGVGPDSGTPAEIFNLRPDAYLWAYSRAGASSVIRTVYTTELPPRL